MKRNHFVVLIAVMLFVGLAGGVAAQSNGPNAPDVAVTTKFTYQGQIKRNDVLFTGTCNMRFTLWDAASAGIQQASYIVPAPVTVSDGVFAVEVDFGAQFRGEARWIQAETQCADDVGYQNLPRVALNPAPYAIGLMPGAVINGDIPFASGNATLKATNASTSGGTALFGQATANSGNTAGVFGLATSPTGAGIWGRDNAGYGVFGESQQGEGVRGVAHNLNHAGVVGVSDGGNFGVYGLSTVQSGVVGESTSGTGVFGHSTTGSGVVGESANLAAVWGKSTNASGVYGTSIAYVGVWGESTDFEGVRGVSHNVNHGGVVGINDAAGGIAVYGNAPNGGYAGYFQGKVGITGGADLAERFATADNAKIEPGTVMVIDEDHSGKLKVSDRAYDGKVIGIISGAGGINTGLTLHQDGALEGDLVVAIAGRVNCKAEANSAPIKPGDLLTTSIVPGHCMKASDRDQAYGAVIGKALTGLDKGEGLVLVLVNLQ